MNDGKFTSIDLEALADPEEYLRGKELMYQGALRDCCRLGKTLAAVVTVENVNYQVKLSFANSKITGECQCNPPRFCRHLVALALRWLQQPQRFRNLQVELKNALSDVDNLAQNFSSFCLTDPLHFLKFLQASEVKESFHEQRALINLIRNTFQGSLLTMVDVQEIWRRMLQLKSLLSAAVAQNDPEIPTACVELLQTILDYYRTYPNQVLLEYLQQLLWLFKELPKKYEPSMIIPLVELVIQLALEPELAASQEMLAELIVSYSGFAPDFVHQVLTDELGNSTELAKLVAGHELLYHLEQSGKLQVTNLLRLVRENLLRNTAGQLWLIDWYLEHELERGVELAREGLQTAEINLAASFRERLLLGLIKQANWCEAAELSLAQFNNEPNLEEYLRLQEILQKIPEKLPDYQAQVVEILKNKPDLKLSLQIGLLKGEIALVKQHLAEILSDEEILFAVIKVCLEQDLTSGMIFYPEFIKGLIARKNQSSWVAARKLLLCYQNQERPGEIKREWQQLRGELWREYGKEVKFREYFGSLL